MAAGKQNMLEGIPNSEIPYFHVLYHTKQEGSLPTLKFYDYSLAKTTTLRTTADHIVDCQKSWVSSS